MNNPKPFNMMQAVDLLMTRAQGTLSDAELQSLARASDDATEQAEWGADLANKVGCLVAFDQSAGSYAAAQDVAALLWHLGATFTNVAALSSLGQFAAQEQARRAAAQVLPAHPAAVQSVAGAGGNQ